jgi:hypothetical protein
VLFTEHDLATELAAQIGKTDLGVTEAREAEVTFGIAEARHNVLMRLDNGQEFLLTVTRFGGPRAQ